MSSGNFVLARGGCHVASSDNNSSVMFKCEKCSQAEEDGGVGACRISCGIRLQRIISCESKSVKKYIVSKISVVIA